MTRKIDDNTRFIYKKVDANAEYQLLGKGKTLDEILHALIDDLKLHTNKAIVSDVNCGVITALAVNNRSIMDLITVCQRLNSDTGRKVTRYYGRPKNGGIVAVPLV